MPNFIPDGQFVPDVNVINSPLFSWALGAVGIIIIITLTGYFFLRGLPAMARYSGSLVRSFKEGMEK